MAQKPKVIIEESLQMRKEGKTNVEIAKRFNASTSAVSAAICKYRREHLDLTDNRFFDRGKMRALLRAGWKIKDVAGDMGFSEERIRKELESPERKLGGDLPGQKINRQE